MKSLSAKMLLSVALTLASVLLICEPRQVQARELEDIINSHEIRLGYIVFPPLEIKDPKTGKLSGSMIEAIESIFNPIQIKPIWVEQTFGTFAAALQSDQIDVFIGGPFATPQRSLALTFTQPYAYMGSDMIVRKEDGVTKYKNVTKLEDMDIDGITIAAPLGGSPYDYLKARFKRAKIVGVESTNQSQGAIEVLAGHADAFYWNAFIGAREVKAHPDQLMSLFGENPVDVAPISWAIKHREPELLKFLNTVLDYMDINGTWIEFEKPYKDQLAGYFHLKREYFSIGSESARREPK